MNRSGNAPATTCKVDKDVSELRIFQGSDMDKFSTPLRALYNTSSIVVSKHPVDVREVTLRKFPWGKGSVAPDSSIRKGHPNELN